MSPTGAALFPRGEPSVTAPGEISDSTSEFLATALPSKPYLLSENDGA